MDFSADTFCLKDSPRRVSLSLADVFPYLARGEKTIMCLPTDTSTDSHLATYTKE